MHIFISYAKADTYDLAVALRDALVALPDITVWMDASLQPAESWAMQIQDEIDRCDYVIVLLSPDVNRRPDATRNRSFVLNEIDYAQQLHKPIIPILAQRTRVPVQLAGMEYIDFASDPQMGMRQLLELIGAYTGRSQALPVDELPEEPPARRGRLFVAGAVLIAVLAIAALTVALSGGEPSTSTPTPTDGSATPAWVGGIATASALGGVATGPSWGARRT